MSLVGFEHENSCCCFFVFSNPTITVIWFEKSNSCYGGEKQKKGVNQTTDYNHF